MPPPSTKRARKPLSRPAKRHKTTARGSEWQHIVNASQSQTSRQNSRQNSPQNSPQNSFLEPENEATFESQLRESQPETAITAPTEGGSEAATATTAEDDDIDDAADSGLDDSLMDNFEGIDWARLRGYMKPLATQTRAKSWVFQYGWRVASIASGGTKVFFICRYCHEHKYIDAGRGGAYDVSKSTSTAVRHLEEDRAGHRYRAPGKVVKSGILTSSWLRQALKSGYKVPQNVANSASSFNVQAFRLAAVSWLVENNHPLREFETPAFKALIAAANPEAAVSLWSSHASVTRYVMRLYDYIKPKVVLELSQSLSKIHISFDGWTTKGGKRGFLGLVAHFVAHTGNLIDLPIALPQLIGAHSGDNIAQVILSVLKDFGVSSSQVGYFMLDNATNNDAAIATISRKLGFNAAHRRLRCAPHTLNLIGQTLLWGRNPEAYDNDSSNLQVCQHALTQLWRTRC